LPERVRALVAAALRGFQPQVGDLTAGQHGVGEVDDERAEVHGQPGVPPGHPAAGTDHLAEPGGDSGAARGAQWLGHGIRVGQVAGERRQVAEGPRGIHGVEPVRVLGAGQAAHSERAAQVGGHPVPVRVGGAQVEPLIITGGRRVDGGQALGGVLRSCRTW
jgi:hypothetical protein